VGIRICLDVARARPPRESAGERARPRVHVSRAGDTAGGGPGRRQAGAAPPGD